MKCVQYATVALADGVQLAAWRAGDPDAEPLVLIAGGGADGSTWSFVVPEVARHPALRGSEGSLADHFLVVGYDQRGTGRSGGAIPLSSSRLAADDALAVAEALAGDRFHVAGMSLGGMAAQRLGLAAPDRVATLSLVATSAGGSGCTPPEHAFLENVTARDADPTVRARENAALGLSAEFPAARPELFDALAARAIATPSSPEAWVAQAMTFATHDTTTELSSLGMPALVVCGDEDRVMPLPNSEFLAAGLPDCRLRVYAGVGHAVDVEASGRLIEDLVQHARSRPVRRARR
jgi:3-oxoadipate enol-lactonase